MFKGYVKTNFETIEINLPGNRHEAEAYLSGIIAGFNLLNYKIIGWRITRI